MSPHSSADSCGVILVSRKSCGVMTFFVAGFVTDIGVSFMTMIGDGFRVWLLQLRSLLSPPSLRFQFLGKQRLWSP